MEELAINNTTSIASLRAKIKTTREMIKGVYAEDDNYIRQDELVKEEKKQLGAIKIELNKRPTVIDLEEKLKSFNEELKEKESLISDCAQEYTRLSSKKQIEKDGVTYDIVTTAKIVRRLR